MAGNVLDSLDAMLKASANNGMWTRFFMYTTGVTTAANATSGLLSAQKFDRVLKLPASFGGGVSQGFCTACQMCCEDATSHFIAGLAYKLGSIDMNAGTFTDGVAMPTKIVDKVSVLTASQMAFCFVSAALTATTPVITITYTDQDGNGSASAALTLPTSPALGSAFFIDPHLANGDTGIRDVTNITKSAGTVGTLDIYGFLLIGTSGQTQNFEAVHAPMLALPSVIWPIEVNDEIHFLRLGQTTSCDIAAVVAICPDNG